MLLSWSATFGCLAQTEEAKPAPAAASSAPSERVLAFYYPWYGNPQTDGHYANWNHAVAVRNEPPRAFPGGDDIGANFFRNLVVTAPTTPRCCARTCGNYDRRAWV